VLGQLAAGASIEREAVLAATQEIELPCRGAGGMKVLFDAR
jgi:hypothetical protein